MMAMMTGGRRLTAGGAAAAVAAAAAAAAASGHPTSDGSFTLTSPTTVATCTSNERGGGGGGGGGGRVELAVTGPTLPGSPLPTLVLVHGLDSTRRTWVRQLRHSFSTMLRTHLSRFFQHWQCAL